MKAVVRDGRWDFTTQYTVVEDFKKKKTVYGIKGLERDLLMFVLEQMNMTFVYVPTPEGFDFGEKLVYKIFKDLYEKRIYIALGALGNHHLNISFFDCNNTYKTMRVRWYVPCSVKYPRWSSIFRILSVELWIILIISIMIVAISATLVGRYSCLPEWQIYKTLTSSLTNAWAVILGVSVSTMPRAPSLRSLFLAWVCFCVAFSTVVQAFLTTFLIDSGYKTPIQNMDELFSSRIKFAYPKESDFLFENADEREASKVQRNRAECPLIEVCVNWAKYQKNLSVLLVDLNAEEIYARGDFFGENSEPLLCRLEDGVVYSYGLTMIMFQGDPLLRRVNEIIDRVVEAGIYNYWISRRMEICKLISRRIAIVYPLDSYYSFNLYHMQPAFYLLLMGLCLSVLCFFCELLYIRVLRKK
jgi:hypothetical protein